LELLCLRRPPAVHSPRLVGRTPDLEQDGPVDVCARSKANATSIELALDRSENKPRRPIKLGIGRHDNTIPASQVEVAAQPELEPDKFKRGIGERFPPSFRTCAG
jgi:hypothetical protein